MSVAEDQQSRADYQYRKIYRYEAPWALYAMNWSMRADRPFRLALGSFMEEYGNNVQLVSLASDWDDAQGDFLCNYTLRHPYPATKIMWIPDPQGIYPDLLATSGDYLRIWRCPTASEVLPCGDQATGGSVHEAQAAGVDVSEWLQDAEVATYSAPAPLDLEPRLECLLNHNKNTHFCSPLTSFDWSHIDPYVLATSSSDTTCTIWALETRQVLGRVSGHGQGTHPREVYDIAFGGSRDVFASVGADGSLRHFDLRRLDRGFLLYQEPNHMPLLRLAWNKHNVNYLATLAMEAKEVAIHDLRMPGSALLRLNSHRAPINGLSWAPHTPGHICTASDDRHALIWDINQAPTGFEEPILSYAANGEINNVQWAATQTDWIAICYKNVLELLRV